MQTPKSFKDLIVWQKSVILAKQIYTMTKLLPKNEEYGLTSQLRRCAVSVPSNIAEGSKRGSKKDFLQFLRIANGSAAELETQLIITREIYPASADKGVDVLLEETQKMLTSLIRKMSS